MKKLLLAIIIFVMFATTVSARTPPWVLTISGEDELAELYKMAEAEEEVLLNYLHVDFIMVGISSRRSLLSFIEHLDSLPVLYVPGTQFRDLSIRDDSTHVSTNFLTEIGELYHFGYFVNAVMHPSEILFTLPVNDGKYINIYPLHNTPPGFELNEYGNTGYLIEVDGLVIRALYNRRGNSRIQSFNPEEAFKDIIITSFRDEPWRTIPAIEDESIIEDKPEPLTTEDALIILQAAMGLIELCDEQIARFEIGDTPETADALRVLRIAVGQN